jgi:hypothetical protein
MLPEPRLSQSPSFQQGSNRKVFTVMGLALAAILLHLLVWALTTNACFRTQKAAAEEQYAAHIKQQQEDRRTLLRVLEQVELLEKIIKQHDIGHLDLIPEFSTETPSWTDRGADSKQDVDEDDLAPRYRPDAVTPHP